jgi:hypothetical protein
MGGADQMRQTLCIALVGLLSSAVPACTKPEGDAREPAETKEPAHVAKSPPSAAEPSSPAPEPSAQAQPTGATPVDVAPPPTGPAQKAETGCAFEEPQFFGMLPAKWEGDCKDGKAHGRGVLRSYDGKKVVATFYGAMEQGNPKLGVVEDRDGLVIGRFAPGGKPIESDEFKDRLDGVNEAVAAAKQTSESYQRAGNAASAAFYAKKAEMLDKQIE